MPKKRIAVFSATGCRTCENIILDMHYQAGPLTRWVDISFWPYILGSQWDELDRMEELDICFFAGAIRTQNDKEAALKLREKCRVLVAVGACAAFGGMPGLVHFGTKKSPFDKAGGETPGDLSVHVDEGPILPRLDPYVSGLSQVVDVDYFIPGCPPTANFVWAGIQALTCETGFRTPLSFAVSRLPEPIAQAVASCVLPPKGSVFAGDKAVCASCSRVKEEKRFETFKRPYEKYEESGRCLLEQGLICQGIATREGCGGLCTGVGIPCRGCFGKAEAVMDPGGKMVSAISSTFDTEKPKEIKKIVDQFVDLTGTFYRYTSSTQCLLLCIGKKE